MWEDWTGGLATTDRAAEPCAVRHRHRRRASRRETTARRASPLAIQQLDVRVRIDDDFAVTEVDQRFFNPSSKKVEGIYRFRAPDGASVSPLRRRSRRRAGLGSSQGERRRGRAVPVQRLRGLDRRSGAARVGRPGRLSRAPLPDRPRRDAPRGRALRRVARPHGRERRAAPLRVPDGRRRLRGVAAAHRRAEHRRSISAAPAPRTCASACPACARRRRH